jgi:hypothetical protein
MQRYDFVPRIKKIAQEELARLRDSPSGSHIDLILKESLLDREYDSERIRNKLFSQSHLWTINSFMDINPYLKGSCDGTLLRSEFLFLRYLGDNSFDHSKRSEYVKHLEETMFDSLPHNVIYRLCDYNNQEFNFLCGNHESRGAARLLEQNELLEIDFEVIKALQKTGRNVEVLVPYVIFPEEFTEIKTRIKAKLGDIKVGTMLEVPANLLEIERYTAADFYVFGPGDLTKNLYGGIDRNSPNFNRVNYTIVFPMLESALDSLEQIGEDKTIYLVKNLIGHNFGKYQHLRFVDMYMPSQLIGD